METVQESTSTPAPQRRKSVPGRTVPKVGMEHSIQSAMINKISQNAFERRRILTVPTEILEANPDKYFVYLNMNELEKNGFWHERGYEVFKAGDMEDQTLVNKFNKSPDGFIHRNEMVLAWIPKEEHERRMMEEKILKGQADISSVLTSNDDLKKLGVFANETKRIVELQQEE